MTVFQAILMKLLSKQAEHRYQSTAGLLSDLSQLMREVCQLRSMGAPSGSPMELAATEQSLQQLSKFQIGRLDLFSTFRLAQRLYGREAMVERLAAAFAQVCATPHAQHRFNSPIFNGNAGKPHDTFVSDSSARFEGQLPSASTLLFMIGGRSKSRT
jgi:hypothetical protein